ncbi:hypothetical protein D3C73_1362350 [compost metagenome]
MNILTGQAADWSIVDINLAAGQFVEADKQIDQCRFTGAGRPNDGDFLPRKNFGGEVFDDRFVGTLIGKFHMLEFHSAGCSVQLCRLLALIVHFLSFQEFEDAFAGC